MKKLSYLFILLIITLSSCELLDLEKTTTLTLKNDESGCTLYYLVVKYPDGEESDNLLSGSSLGYGSTKEIEIKGTGAYTLTVSKFEEGYPSSRSWRSVMGTSPAVESFTLSEGDEKEITYTQEKRYYNNMQDYWVDEVLWE